MCCVVTCTDVSCKRSEADYAPGDDVQVPEGLVAVCRNNTGTGTLRVVTIDRLGEPFKQKVLKLTYTPRKLLVDVPHGVLISIEADKGMQPLPHRTDLQVCPGRAETGHGTS